MKKNLIRMLALGSFAFCVSSAEATLLAQWTPHTGGNPTSINADSGYSSYFSATPTFVGANATGQTLVNPIVSSLFHRATASGTTIGGTIVTLTLHASSAISLSGLSVTINNAQNILASGPGNHLTGTWTENGVSQGGVTLPTVITGSTTLPFSLSAITLDSLDSYTLSLSFAVTGVSGDAGFYFGNFQLNGTITPVPEPTNYALAGFGLIFVGGGASRFYLARRRFLTAS